jgi:hypothetical protein
MAAERQLGLDQLLERCDPEVVEPGDLALGEWLVGEVCKGRATPQRERILERRHRALWATGGELAPALGEKPLEAV